MSLKNLDYLSPKITLFYYGRKRHYSFLGGLLTILMIILSSCYISYLIYSIAIHSINNFMLYKTFLIDAGQYYFNDTTGIFHFFQLYDIKTNEYGEYKTKYARIFMSRLYKSYMNNREILSENEHWVYDNCREGVDNKHVDQNLFIDNISFKNGACLRYYYNNDKKKYYPIEDEINFRYPYLIHGTGNKDNLFLETIVEKCDNSSVISTILGFCGSENEIDDYFEQFKGINLQLINENTKIVAIFDYWLQNSAQVIKGGYSSLYDILPSIGGIIQLIYYIFYSFNYLYNKYITIQDCNNSFFRMYNSEDPKGVPMKKQFIRSVNSLREEVQKLFPKNKIVAAKNERRDSIFIAKYHRHKKSLKSDLGNNSLILNDENNKNNLSNSNDIIINIQNNFTKNTVTYNKRISVPKQTSKFKSKNDELLNTIELDKKDILADKFEGELRQFIIKKNKTFKVEPFNINITSKFMNLFNFFFYVIKFKEKSKIYFILNQFRLKLLGEEHLFKSNIILYHIEKYFNVKEIQKVDILELYQNL